MNQKFRVYRTLFVCVAIFASGYGLGRLSMPGLDNKTALRSKAPTEHADNRELDAASMESTSVPFGNGTDQIAIDTEQEVFASNEGDESAMFSYYMRLTRRL